MSKNSSFNSKNYNLRKTPNSLKTVKSRHVRLVRSLHRICKKQRANLASGHRTSTISTFSHQLEEKEERETLRELMRIRDAKGEKTSYWAIAKMGPVRCASIPIESMDKKYHAPRFCVSAAHSSTKTVAPPMANPRRQVLQEKVGGGEAGADAVQKAAHIVQQAKSPTRRGQHLEIPTV